MYIWEVPDDWDDGGLLITVGRAFLVLQGHRSIVNQVRFNRANHMLISAGVEKVLKVGYLFYLIVLIYLDISIASRNLLIP